MIRTPEQIRLEAVLDRSELAERAGVCESTVGNLERGKVRKLHALTLEKIGVALKNRFKDRGETFTLREYIEAVMAVRKKGRAQ